MWLFHMLSTDMHKLWLIKEADVLTAISSRIMALVNYTKKIQLYDS